jgi:hypothetical protein
MNRRSMVRIVLSRFEATASQFLALFGEWIQLFAEVPFTRLT